ncbi:MAG: CAP domain-containing protein [Dehalococcoidia bacterium]
MRRQIRNLTLTALAVLLLAGGALGVQRAQAQVAVAAFASTPVFDARGTAFAVFGGGTIGQLEAAAQQAGATGVWAQDGAGAYQLLVVQGPAFLTAPFTSAFPGGFTSATAVTLVRPAGGAPAATATPSATPSATATATATPAATPSATATPAPTATATPALGYDGQVAAMVFIAMNGERKTNGVNSLARNSLLDQSAAAYAKVVFDRDPYLAGATNPHELDGQPWDRATRVGYQWSAFYENLSALYGGVLPTSVESGMRTVSGWMESPGHRTNLLQPEVEHTGVGCYSGQIASPRTGYEQGLICVAVYAKPQ